jgi:AraC-like DNA-binding protein
MIPATHSMCGDGRVVDRLGAAICTGSEGRERDGSPLSRAAPGLEKCLVECVEEDLARNFGAQITLRDIERSSGYSVYQIIRTFRRRLGMTPHAYLIRMRLHYAAERLLQGDTIAGAAAEAGFADQSHMTRHFKRVFGTTPRQYVLGQSRAGSPAAGSASLS